jgi:hypothetical protein
VSGSVDANTVAGSALNDATSYFELTFDVLQAVAFTLDGFGLARESDPGPVVTTGVTLTGGPGNQTIVQEYVSSDGDLFVFEQGVLLPGQYTLIARSEIQGFGIAGYAFSNIELSMVPEPATGLLLAGGLLALAIRRRRRSV